MPTDKTPLTQDEPHTTLQSPAQAGQDGGGNAKQGKPLPALLASLVLLAAILVAFGAGVYFVLWWLPDWEHRVLFGLLTFSVLLFVLMLRDTNRPAKTTTAVEPIPDAASPEEQQAALEALAGLPQFCRLNDGTLFDYLQGITVRPCRCGEESPFHLKVRYGKGRQASISLVSRGALTQFLAVQVALGEGLQRAGSANGMPAHIVPTGGAA